MKTSFQRFFEDAWEKAHELSFRDYSSIPSVEGMLVIPDKFEEGYRITILTSETSGYGKVDRKIVQSLERYIWNWVNFKVTNLSYSTSINDMESKLALWGYPKGTKLFKYNQSSDKFEFIQVKK